MLLLSLTLHPINFETKVATPDNQVSKIRDTQQNNEINRNRCV